MGLPFFFAMIVLAPEFMLVMYGGQWTPSILPFQLLCIVGALRCQRLCKRSDSGERLRLGGVRADLIRNIILVVALYALQPWGIVGAAAAVVCSALSSMVMTQTLLNQLVGLRWSQLAAPMLQG